MSEERKQLKGENLIRKQHAGVGFFAIAREEKLARQKKDREVKKNAKSRHKITR